MQYYLPLAKEEHNRLSTWLFSQNEQQFKFKVSNILETRERVRRSAKIIKLPKHTGPPYYSKEKK